MKTTGFSLLECLVAMTIIGLVILPMFMIITREQAFDRRIQLKDLALEIAKSEIKGVKDKILPPSEKEINLGGRNFVIIYEIDHRDLRIFVREKGKPEPIISLTTRR